MTDPALSDALRTGADHRTDSGFRIADSDPSSGDTGASSAGRVAAVGAADDAGRRDRLTPFRRSAAIAAAISGARLVEVKGAGHILPWEAADLVAAVSKHAAARGAAHHLAGARDSDPFAGRLEETT